MRKPGGVGSLSDERLGTVAALVEARGYKLAAEALNIKKEAVKRYMREWRNRQGKSEKKFDTKVLEQLAARFTEAELKQILNSGSVNNQNKKLIHDFDGEEVCFGVLSDTHFGSVYTDPAMLKEALEKFAYHDVDFIVAPGDIFEGLSNRAGHVYECSHIGYSAQLDHGRELMAQWTDTPVYLISGNHDRWFIKSVGANICEELCRDQENLHFMGHDEGDIQIGSVTLRLWHGEDGSSYAFSYRIQKIVESFTGGEKPDVLVCGHSHKAIYVYDRHIHCLSGGAIQKQSKYMRSKRLASHTGFWICHMGINDLGVAWFEPRFYPFYV
jgi:predicted phosphodiesterase